jgi:hypothetical protein
MDAYHPVFITKVDTLNTAFLPCTRRSPPISLISHDDTTTETRVFGFIGDTRLSKNRELVQLLLEVWKLTSCWSSVSLLCYVPLLLSKTIQSACDKRDDFFRPIHGWKTQHQTTVKNGQNFFPFIICCVTRLAECRIFFLVFFCPQKGL